MKKIINFFTLFLGIILISPFLSSCANYDKNYQIYDLNTAIENKEMTEEDIVWWGFDDTTLYEYAKKQLTKILAFLEYACYCRRIFLS